jgi:hypothetical protein
MLSFTQSCKFCAVLCYLKLCLQGVEAVELEVETPDDVILDNGQIRLKTEAEKLAEEKERKLAELKSGM